MSAFTRVRAQDVPDFLRPVEVHDRHNDRAEVRHRIERRRGFEPVRQLERNGISGTDAAGAQARREPAGERVDIAERAAERIAVGSHREGVIARIVQSGGEQLTETLVAPEALGDVAAGVLLVDLARRELHSGER